jgi:Leucine Rich repeat
VLLAFANHFSSVQHRQARWWSALGSGHQPQPLAALQERSLGLDTCGCGAQLALDLHITSARDTLPRQQARCCIQVNLATASKADFAAAMEKANSASTLVTLELQFSSSESIHPSTYNSDAYQSAQAAWCRGTLTVPKLSKLLQSAILAQLTPESSLRHLHISVPIPRCVAEEFGLAVSTATSLTCLSLRGSLIGDARMASILIGMRAASQVTTLDVSGCLLSDPGAQALAELVRVRAIRCAVHSITHQRAL